MKNCLGCSHLSGMNISQTGRHCGASMQSHSPVSDFVVFNPQVFFCSQYESAKRPEKGKIKTNKERYDPRTQAASA